MLSSEPPDGRGPAGDAGETGEDDLCAGDSEQGGFVFVSPPKTCGPDALTGRRSVGDFNFFSGCERAGEGDTTRALAVSSSYVAPVCCPLPLPPDEGGAQSETYGEPKGSDPQSLHAAPVENERTDPAFFSSANDPPQTGSSYYPVPSSFVGAPECGASHSTHFLSASYASSSLYPRPSASYCPPSASYHFAPSPYGAPAPSHVSPLPGGAACAPVLTPGDERGGTGVGAGTAFSLGPTPSPRPPAGPPDPSPSYSSPFSPPPFWTGSDSSQVPLVERLEPERAVVLPSLACPPGAACGSSLPPGPHVSFLPPAWPSSAPVASSAPHSAVDLPFQNACPGASSLSPFAVPPTSSVSPIPNSAAPHSARFPSGDLHASGLTAAATNSSPFSPAACSGATGSCVYQHALGVSGSPQGCNDCSFPLAPFGAAPPSPGWSAPPAASSASGSGRLPCTGFSDGHSPVAASQLPSPHTACEAAPTVPGPPTPAMGTDGGLSSLCEGQGGEDGGKREDKNDGNKERKQRATSGAEAEVGNATTRAGLRIASRFPPALAISADAACSLQLAGPSGVVQEEERDGEKGGGDPRVTRGLLGSSEDALSPFSSVLLYFAAGRLQAEGEDELSSALYRHLIKSRRTSAANHLPSCHNWKGEVRLLVPEESTAVLPHRLRPASQRWSLAPPSRSRFDGSRSEDGCLLSEDERYTERSRRRPASRPEDEVESHTQAQLPVLARGELLKEDVQLFLADLVALLSSRVPGHLSVHEFLQRAWPSHLALPSVSSERPQRVADAPACEMKRHEDFMRPSQDLPIGYAHLRSLRPTFSSPGSSSSGSGSSLRFLFNRNLFLLHRSGRFSRALLPPPRTSVPSCSDSHTLSSGFFLSGAAHALLPLSSPLLLSSSLVKTSSILGAFPRAVSPAAAAAFASGCGAHAATAVGAAAVPWLAWSGKVKRVANVWGHQISHEELLSGERPALDNQFQIGLVREPAAVYVVRYDATGSVIFTGGDDGLVKAWDAATGQLVYALIKHQGDITDIDLHPNNSLLLSGCGKGEVRLWRVLPAGWIPICTILVPERVAWARFLPERHCEGGREDREKCPLDEGRRRRGALREEDGSRHEKAQADDDAGGPTSLVIVGCDDQKIRFYDLRALLETPPAGGPGGRTTVLPLLEADWGAPLLPRAMDLSKVPLDASGSFLLALGLEAPSEPSSSNEGSEPALPPAPPSDPDTSSLSVFSCSLLSSRSTGGQSDGGVHTRSTSSPPSSAYRALVVRTPSLAHLRLLRRQRREEEERRRRERRRDDGKELLGVCEARGGSGLRDEGRRRTRFGGETKSKIEPDKTSKFPGLLFADLTPFHSSFPDVCFAWHSPDLVTGGDDGNLFLWSFSSLSGASPATSASCVSRLRPPSTRRGGLHFSASNLSSHKFFLLSLSVQRLLEGRYLPGSARTQPSSPMFPCSLFHDSPPFAAASSSGSLFAAGGAPHAFSASPFSSLSQLAQRQGGRMQGRVQGRSAGASGRHSSSSSISSSSSDSSGASDAEGEAGAAGLWRGRRGRQTRWPSGSRLSRRPGVSCGGSGLGRVSPTGSALGLAFGPTLEKEVEMFSVGVGDQPRHAADASGVRYSLLALSFSCDDALICIADAVSRKTSKARLETLKPVDQSLSFFPSPASSGPLKSCRVGSLSLQGLSEGLVSQLKPHPSCPLLLLCSTFSGEVLLLDVSETHARARAGMGSGVTLCAADEDRGDGVETEETAHLKWGTHRLFFASGRDQGRRDAFAVPAAERATSRSFCCGDKDEETKYNLPWHWEGGCTVIRKLRFGSQCSWLDMAWAPNGLQFAGTHRLGCLSIFAHGSSPLFEVTLFEQFLSSESRDTRRDATSLLLTDAGTRQAPHLLCRGILMDAARQPYPLHLQPPSVLLPLLSVGCRNAHLYMCLRCLRRRLPGALRSDASMFLRQMYAGENNTLAAPFANLRISACPCCPDPEKAWQFGDPFKCPFCYGDSSLGVGNQGSEAGQDAGPGRGDAAQQTWGGASPEARGDHRGLQTPRAQAVAWRRGGVGDRSSLGVGEGERERRLRRLEGRLAAQLADPEGDSSPEDEAARSVFQLFQQLPPTSHLALRLECLLRRRLRRHAVSLLRSQEQAPKEPRVQELVALPSSASAAIRRQGKSEVDEPRESADTDGESREEKADRPGAEGEGERAPEKVDEETGETKELEVAKESGEEARTGGGLEAFLEAGKEGAQEGDRGEEDQREGRSEEERVATKHTQDKKQETRDTGLISAVSEWDDEDDFSLLEEEGQASQAGGWIEEDETQPPEARGSTSSGGQGYWSTTDVAVSNEARRLEILHKHRLEHHCIWKLHRCSSRGNILILRSFAASLLQGRRMPAALVRPPLEDDSSLTQVNLLSSVSSLSVSPSPSRQHWASARAG
ncbi:WD domain, G-beta repeat-containing protein, partial [Toxoplasma gondii FOU]